VGSLLVLVFAINKQPRLDSSVKEDNDRLRVSDDNDDGDNGGRTKKGEFSSFQISPIHETFQRSQTPCPFNSNEIQKNPNARTTDSLHSLQSIKYNPTDRLIR